MPRLVIFINIISHPIARDRLINLRNAGTDETSSKLLAIQTWIANPYRLKYRHRSTSSIPLVIQTRTANQCHL
jgi:hypothetical protein